MIWSYHFLTIVRGRGGKVKNFKKQPCTFEAFQQKSRSEEEKKELERLLGIVGSRGV